MKSEIGNPRPGTRAIGWNLRPGVARSNFVLLLFVALVSIRAVAADLSQAVSAAMQYESGKPVEPLRQIEDAVRNAVADARQRPALEAALIQLLAPEATFEARRFACVQLAALGSDACLPAVSRLLTQPETVGIACLALGTHPSDQADALLLKALAAHQGDTRVQIIVTLGDRRVAQTVPSLAPLAGDADRNTREAAMGALGKIASPNALSSLATLRRDAQTEIARLAALASLAAADSIAQEGNSQNSATLYEELLASSQPFYVRRAALEGLLRTDADGGEQRCLTVLRGNEAALKPSALYHVRTIRNPQASAVFAAELSHLTPKERVLLIDSLAARNDATAREAIVTQTQAQDETVRQAAVVALVEVGDASVVPALARLMANSTAAQQQTLEMALASLKGEDQVDREIIRALESGPATARPGLLNAAARRGAKRAVPMMLTLVGSDDAATARAAFRALGQVAEPSVLPELIDHLLDLKVPAARGDAEIAVIRLLERDPDPDRRSQIVLQALSRAKDTEGRSSLIALLPACSDARALAAAKAERAGTDAMLREAALRALTEWPDPMAVDTLLTEAEQASGNNERVLALRGAVRLLRQSGDVSPATVRSQFQRALALAHNANEKKLMLSGLAGVQHEFALQLLAPYLDDPEVRAEAVQAAITLGPRLGGAFPEPAKALLEKLVKLPIDAGVRESAARWLDVMDNFDDFIVAWQVAGPFVEEGRNGEALFEVAFPPEQTGASGVAWQILPAGTLPERPWQLDLAGLFGGDNRVAYARVWVHSAVAQPARLELGADDGVKAWFNRRVVISHNRGGDVVPGSEKTAITLNPGWNSLLLKITQWSAGWGFCAKIVRPDGTALDGLRLSAIPPVP